MRARRPTQTPLPGRHVDTGIAGVGATTPHQFGEFVADRARRAALDGSRTTTGYQRERCNPAEISAAQSIQCQSLQEGRLTGAQPADPVAMQARWKQSDLDPPDCLRLADCAGRSADDWQGTTFGEGQDGL